MGTTSITIIVGRFLNNVFFLMKIKISAQNANKDILPVVTNVWRTNDLFHKISFIYIEVGNKRFIVNSEDD